MKFKQKLLLLLTLTLVLSLSIVSSISVQEKTLILGDIIDIDGDPILDAKVTVTCNENVQSYTTSDSGSYIVSFDSSSCSPDEIVNIKAEKSGFQSASAEAQVKVRKCAGEFDDICSAYSGETEIVFDIAIKSLSLDIDVPARARNKGGIPTTLVPTYEEYLAGKNKTALQVESTQSPSPEKETEEKTEFNSNTEEIQEESQKSSGITGAAIGALGQVSMIVVIAFFIIMVIAYIYVKNRKSDSPLPTHSAQGTNNNQITLYY